MTIDAESLSARAYAAFDGGRLGECVPLFERLAGDHPERPDYQYMLGLAHKYRRDWRPSLLHNLRAIELGDGKDAQAECWNAAIAATALFEWDRARVLWAKAGVRVPAGDGPIEADFGVASLRLNPWGDAETLYGRRVDPARARLLNVPFPESGYRYGDLVLHDGASTGTRAYDGVRVPVFNVLQRLEASNYDTFVAQVNCASPSEADALVAMTGPGIGEVEDWTGSVMPLCLQCSYGEPHEHAPAGADEWQAERRIGIAAQGWTAAEALLERWEGDASRSRLRRLLRGRAPGRRVESLDLPEVALSSPSEGMAWWQAPEPEPAQG